MRSIRKGLTCDPEYSPSQLRADLHSCYTLIVKCEMWRQRITGDYSKIRLFNKKRSTNHRSLDNGTE